MNLKLLVILSISGVIVFCPSLRGAVQSDDVAVVVSERNRINAISIAELRKLLAGERHSWTGGTPVKILTRKPGTRERQAMLQLLGMSESEYKKYWLAQVFRGEADCEPVILPSIGMQIVALSVYPGGITLVVARDVKPGMKMLKINGHLPGTEGYPAPLASPKMR